MIQPWGLWQSQFEAKPEPKIGRPHRDRAKVKASRKAARRNR